MQNDREHIEALQDLIALQDEEINRILRINRILDEENAELLNALREAREVIDVRGGFVDKLLSAIRHLSGCILGLAMPDWVRNLVSLIYPTQQLQQQEEIEMPLIR